MKRLQRLIRSSYSGDWSYKDGQYYLRYNGRSVKMHPPTPHAVCELINAAREAVLSDATPAINAPDMRRKDAEIEGLKQTIHEMAIETKFDDLVAQFADARVMDVQRNLNDAQTEIRVLRAQNKSMAIEMARQSDIVAQADSLARENNRLREIVSDREYARKVEEESRHRIPVVFEMDKSSAVALMRGLKPCEQ